MTISSFERALTHVLAHEGGYVRHPADPGGATNRGITQATYDAWRGAKGLPSRSVRELTDAELRDIYRRRYWDAVRADDLPAGIDHAVFDFGVNSGPRRAIQFLQRTLGVADDGTIGPVTLGAARAADPAACIGSLCDARLAWLRHLAHWPTFGRGWSSRVDAVRREALAMAGAAPSPGTVDPHPTPRRPALVSVAVAVAVAAAIVCLALFT